MRVTAKLKYRTYVPDNHIAIPFCNVDIYGSTEIRDEWDKIERKCEHDYHNETQRLDRDYDHMISSMKYKADDFLRRNGFVPINVSSVGSECTTTTEIWEKNN